MAPTPRPRAADFSPRSLMRTGLTPRNIKALFAAYRTLPLKHVALGAVLTLALVAVGTIPLEYPTLAVTLAAAGVLLALDLTIRFSSFVATLIVIALVIGLTAPIALVYPASVGAAYADAPDAVASYFATLVLAGLIAHRTSRGRPWVTTLIAGLGLAFVGTTLATLISGLGFAWAWLVVALVLWYRAAGKPWLIRQIKRAWRRIRRLPAPTENTEARNKNRADRATVRARKNDAGLHTASLLTGLPDTYTIHTNVPTERKHTAPVQHVITGPTGIFAVESENIPGEVIDDPNLGLSHKTVPVAHLLDRAARRSTALRRRLPRRHLLGHTSNQAIVVIHEAALPIDVAGVAISTSDGERFVLVTAPDALIDVLTTGKQRLKQNRLAKINARLEALTTAQPTPAT